jgi:hypothetical protein
MRHIGEPGWVHLAEMRGALRRMHVVDDELVGRCRGILNRLSAATRRVREERFDRSGNSGHAHSPVATPASQTRGPRADSSVVRASADVRSGLVSDDGGNTHELVEQLHTLAAEFRHQRQDPSRLQLVRLLLDCTRRDDDIDGRLAVLRGAMHATSTGSGAMAGSGGEITGTDASSGARGHASGSIGPAASGGGAKRQLSAATNARAKRPRVTNGGAGGAGGLGEGGSGGDDGEMSSVNSDFFYLPAQNEERLRERERKRSNPGASAAAAASGPAIGASTSAAGHHRRAPPSPTAAVFLCGALTRAPPPAAATAAAASAAAAAAAAGGGVDLISLLDDDDDGALPGPSSAKKRRVQTPQDVARQDTIAERIRALDARITPSMAIAVRRRARRFMSHMRIILCTGCWCFRPNC